MKRFLGIAFVALTVTTGCGDASSNDDREVAPECGGCSLPPTCNADGTARSPYPRCACGCHPGQQFPGGICNENSCIVPTDPSATGDAATPDRATADAATGDGGTRDAATDDGGTVLTCSGDAATPSGEPVVAPSTDEWRAVREELSSQGDGGTLPASIDPSACLEGLWMVWLPFGSAYVHVHRRDDGDCELWLGGETEDPSYDGTPTQYCRFPSSCKPVTPEYGSGGPASIDSPFCT